MTESRYNRRDFMKAGLAGMAVNGLYADHARTVPLQADTRIPKERGRPNIILFFTDQQRLSALGAYGKTVCRTPVLDRLAAEGVLFENAYTSCPLCSPARASLITGQHIHAHRIGANTYEFGCNVNELPDTPALLPRKLQSAGYRCGYTGKWHIGSRTSLPSSVGFEGIDFPGHGGGGFGYPEYKAYLKEHGYRHRVRRHATDGVKIRNYGVLEDVVESSVPYYLAENTMALIDQFDESGDPFFIWHNNWGPHEPYYVPQEYYELYDLARDPHEMTNLLEDPAYAEIADMMRRRIYTFMVKTRYPGSNNFRLSRLGYSNERQYVHGPDPVDQKTFLVEDMAL